MAMKPRFKVGDRVVDTYFQLIEPGIGQFILVITQVDENQQSYYGMDEDGVARARQFEDDELVLESVYNSEVYKILNGRE